MHTSLWKNLTGSSSVICFCVVRGFEEENSLENLRYALFCLIEKRSIESFVFFLPFFLSQNAGSQLCFIVVVF